MTEDEMLEAEVRDILAELPFVTVRKDGLGWLVGCGFNGIEQAGHTSISDQTSEDPRDLARRLLARALPISVIEPEPSPVNEGQQDEDSEQEESGEEVSNEVEHVGVAAPYVDLDALKEALRLRILAEAVRRSGMSMELFERINAVHAVINDEHASAAAKNDAELELQMHGVWSERAKEIDTAKTLKLVEVMGLETLEDINAYDVNAGWP